MTTPLLAAVLKTVERLPAAVVAELAQKVLRASPQGPTASSEVTFPSRAFGLRPRRWRPRGSLSRPWGIGNSPRC